MSTPQAPTSKTIAITQSNYIPWKGYFDLIAAVDELVIYDAMQFTRRDWRNRNKIKTQQGLQWLTIPVETKGLYFQRIDETQIQSLEWANQHWERIRHSYGKSPGFALQGSKLEELYRTATSNLLTEVNRHFLEGLCKMLGIRTPLRDCREYEMPEGQTERLIAICKQAGATDYLSGPAARDYIDATLFEQAGIALHYMDYSGYLEYPQLHGAFDHAVSVVDLILATGPDAPKFMKFTHHPNPDD